MIKYIDNSRRIFTDAFDYNSRRKKKGLDFDLNAARAMIARLRLDALLFDKIVLTDVQVLHSLFLSGLSSCSYLKERVFEKIPFGSIEIRMRAPTLQDSLVGLVHGTNEKLLPHLFTYIDPSNWIGEEISKIQKSRVSSHKDLIEILLDITEGTEAFDRVQASQDAWNLWIEAAQKKRGGLDALAWDTAYPFTQHSTTYLSEVIKSSKISTATEYGTDLIRRIQNGKMSRGEIAAKIIKQDQKQTILDDEFRDLEKVEYIYSSAYNRAAANQHFCRISDTNVSLDFSGSRTDEETGRRPEILSHPSTFALSREYDLPHWFLVALSDMPTKTFERFKEDMSTNVENMWDGNHVPTLRDLVKLLVEKAIETGLPNYARDERNEKLSSTNSTWRGLNVGIQALAAGLGAALEGPAAAAIAAATATYITSDVNNGEDLKKEIATTSLVNFGVKRMGWDRQESQG